MASFADVFISEYIESSSNNKALELYNPSGSAIDLSAGNYSVEIYFNGHITADNTINLSGSIASSGTYVIAHSSAGSDITAAADQTTGSLSFNGNDAIVLKKNSTVLDSIGQVGDDPGSYWGDADVATMDFTLWRKVSVTAGDTDPSDSFDPASEWYGLTDGTYWGLGDHAVYPYGWQHQDINGASGGGFSISGSNYTVNGAGDLKTGGTADTFHYAYQHLTGDGHIQAEVTSFAGDLWADRCGIMLRERLSGGSRHGFAGRMGHDNRGNYFQVRTVEDKASTEKTKWEAYPYPYWLKIERSGNTLSGYISQDGASWTLMDSVTIDNLAPVLFAGFAVGSVNSATVRTAIYSDYSFSDEATYVDPVSDVTAAFTNNNIDLSWTSPAGIQGVLILRQTNAVVIDVPDVGTAYTNGQVLPNGAVVVSTNQGTSFLDTAPAVEATNFYKLFAYKSPSMFYAQGIAPSPVWVPDTTPRLNFSSVQSSPYEPEALDNVVIQAGIQGVYGAVLQDASAWYRLGTSGTFSALGGMTNAGITYTTTNSIPQSGNGTIVQYYLKALYDVSSTIYTSYYPATAPTELKSYVVGSSGVWINEVKYDDLWWGLGPWGHIELAGSAGLDIKNWYLEITTNAFLSGTRTYYITNNTVLANDSGGLGFWVIGNSTNEADRDQYLENQGTNSTSPMQLWKTPLTIALYNDASNLEHAISFDGSFADFERINVSDYDSWPGTSGVSVVGQGSAYDDFTWDTAAVTPGGPNEGQLLVGVSMSVVDDRMREAPAPTNLAQFALTRTYAQEPLTVYYAVDTSNSTAGASDYQALSGLALFTNGQMTSIVTVTPQDDSLEEGEELLSIYMLPSTNNSYFITDNNQVVLIIEDDDRNYPPVVDAGPDTTMALNDTLQGAVVDDGKPTNETLIIQWVQVSGPGVVVFNNASNPTTDITFPVGGQYVLRLYADDGASDFTATQVWDAVTIVADATTPEIQTIIADYNGTNVHVTFSEPVQPASATNWSYYSFDDLTVQGGAMSDSNAVILYTSLMAPGASYQVSISNITDVYGNEASDLAGICKHLNLLRDGSFDGHLFYSNSVTTWSDSQDPIYTWYGDPTLWSQTSSNLLSITNTSFGGYRNVMQIITNIPETDLHLSFTYHKKAGPGEQGLYCYVMGFPSSGVALDMQENPESPLFTVPNGSGDYLLMVTNLLEIPNVNNWSTFSTEFSVSTNYEYLAVLFRAGNLSDQYVDLDDVLLREANQAPVVDAGVDRLVGRYRTNTFAGTVQDDGFPTNGTMTYAWSRPSGIGAYTIYNSTGIAADVMFENAGTNILRLTVSDGVLTNYDELTVVVDPGPPSFVAPYPNTSRVFADQLTLNMMIDEAGSIYYALLPNNAPAPSSEQLKAGLDAANNSLPTNLAGTVSASTTSLVSAVLTGLESNTAYDIYMAAEDLVPLLQITPTKLDIVTASYPAPLAYEPFDYPPLQFLTYGQSSSSANQNGGFGWKDAWVHDKRDSWGSHAMGIPTVVTNLSYAGIITEGRSVGAMAENGPGANTTIHVYRDLEGGFSPGNVYWLSCLMTKDSNTGRNDPMAMISLHVGYTDYVIGFQQRYGEWQTYGAAWNSSYTLNSKRQTGWDRTVDSGTSLLVMKLSLTGGSTHAYMWVNPTNFSSEASMGEPQMTVWNSSTAYAFDGITLQADWEHLENTVFWDEIRIGTALPSVLPTAAAVEDDADEDGIPDWFEIIYFGGATNADAAADHDGDGMNNWEEWYAGTHPTNGNSYFEIMDFEQDASAAGMVLSWPSTTGRTYRLYYSSNLIEGFELLQGAVPATPMLNVFTDTVHDADQSVIYRLEINKP